MGEINFANDFELFRNDQLGSVRAFYKDKMTWFVLKDVCDILNITNHRNAMARLEDYEKDVHIMDTPGGSQQMSIVNEYGLYNLIFSSRKPQAKEFRRWVVCEVLPSIHQHGGYVYGQERLPEKERGVIEEELADMASMIKKLRARRHELIGENRQLKDDKRQLKKEQKALNEYADLFEDMFEKAQGEYAKAVEEVEVLKNRIERMKHPEAFAEPERGPKMFVTNDGMVISSEVWDTLKENRDEDERDM